MYKTTLYALLMIVFLVGCGDDDNTNAAGDTVNLTGTYAGYAQDASGEPLFVQTFITNEDIALMQYTNSNDDVTVLEGNIVDDTIVFDEFTCSVSTTEMVCNNYALEALTLETFDFTGTYKGVDTEKNIWTMLIDSEGAVTISNTENTSCLTTGTISLETSHNITTFVLNVSGCATNDGTAYGVVLPDSLYSEADTLNVLNLTDSSSTFWFKQ